MTAHSPFQQMAIYNAIVTPKSNWEKSVVSGALEESHKEFAELYKMIYTYPQDKEAIFEAVTQYVEAIEDSINENVGENDPYQQFVMGIKG